MIRILCAILVAASMTILAMTPAAAAQSCYVDWNGQGSVVACGEPRAALAGSDWTWAFVAGWASMVALLLLTERCARRRELEASVRESVSPLLGSSRQVS